MKKTMIWKLLICLGTLPFIFVLVSGIYHAIDGWSFCIGINCPQIYGLVAFYDYVLLASFVYWPFYIAGIVLILIGLYLLKKKTK